MENNKRIRRKVLSSYIVSTVSIALVLFLLGSVGYMLYSAASTAKQLKDNITLSVELSDEIEDETLTALEAEIKTLKGVTSITYSDKAQKISDEEFRAMFDAEIEGILDENPLRNSLEVAISSLQRKEMDAVVATISQMEGVVYVAYPAATIERLHSSIRKILIVMTAFGGALFIISLILLHNTIRLAIYSRRHLINTFKLVGATKWYIMKPFIRTAIKQGLYAGVGACLLFAGSLFGLKETLPEIISMASLTKYGVVMATMLGSGVIVSILFTIFSVNRFINMQSNKIHLY